MNRFVQILDNGERTSFILGSEEFQNTVRCKKQFEQFSNEVSDRIYIRPTLAQIIKVVSIVYKIPKRLITDSHRGKSNDARMMTMLIAKKDYGYDLVDIAKEMRLSNTRSVSALVGKFNLRMLRSIELEWLHQRILSEIKLVNEGEKVAK